MGFYEALMQPFLFRLDPETAHQSVVAALAAAGHVPGARRTIAAAFGYRHPALETEVAGLRFPNPVGLAAGFDKDCRLAGVLPAFGFGFLELGTVTPRPQPGNPRPRLFRIPEAGAILNRLGFNSCGAARAAANLSSTRRPAVPVGINLGMNADTPPEKAAQDYADAFSALRAHGDYFVVNVSSPNTRGLRELQDRLQLERILSALRPVNPDKKPVFVKLSPDLEPGQLAALAPLLLRKADGIVAANTTLARNGLPERWLDARGGVSGIPLRDRSTNFIADIRRLTGGNLPIIGVGGVFNAQDAYQKLRAGASLVQIYTGWIYRGPGLVREINRGLAQILRQHGLKSIRDAVGRSADAPGLAAAGPAPANPA